MPDPAEIKRLDQQISAVAGLIAEYRQLTERLKFHGRNAEASQAALRTLEKVFRHRLLDRLDVQQEEHDVRPRRASR